jgi:phage gp36-like protein
MPLPASILTPLSSDTAFATPQDLVARFSVQDIRQWASDADLPLTVQGILTNVKVATALQDASGEIEAACLMSDKYQPQDLLNLTGNSLAKLKRLTCELAIGYLFENRLRRGDEDPPGVVVRAHETLERFRKGEWVFGFAEAGAAGLIGHMVETPCDVATRNMVTRQAGRYFGRRSNQYWDYGPANNNASPQEGGTGLVGGP